MHLIYVYILRFKFDHLLEKDENVDDETKRNKKKNKRRTVAKKTYMQV